MNTMSKMLFRTFKFFYGDDVVSSSVILWFFQSPSILRQILIIELLDLRELSV